jgi:AcrR family transcriptional regulator
MGKTMPAGRLNRPANARAITVPALIARAAKMFAAKGVRATTLTEIAADFGVTKAALYYHVKNKYELLWMIFDHIMDIDLREVEAVAQEDLEPKEKFRQLVIAHARTIIRDKAKITVFFREQPQLLTKDRQKLRLRIHEYEQIFQDCYRDGVNAGVFRDLDPKLVVKAVLGMFNSLKNWYDPRGEVSPEQIGALYLEIVERGLLSPSASGVPSVAGRTGAAA